jgi:hypothetical protein
MKHEILFKHTGENAPTARSPSDLWKGQVDLGELVSRCRSFDDDGQTTVRLYEVATVTLPDWLPAEEWLREPIKWKYLRAVLRTKDLELEEVPEYIARFLVELGTMYQLACVKLLATQKFRSEFRSSLCAQLESWMIERWERRNKYGSPFSSKQWNALCDVHTSREAQYISSDTYYSRGEV